MFGKTGFFEFLFIFSLASIILVPAIIAMVFFFLSLNKALRITKKFHTFTPGQVWLLFIPFFSLWWQFQVVKYTTIGIKGIYKANGRDCDEASYSVGIAWCIFVCLCFIPYLNFLTIIPGFILWIIYWVSIAGYNNEMEKMQIKSPAIVDTGSVSWFHIPFYKITVYYLIVNSLVSSTKNSTTGAGAWSIWRVVFP